MTPEELRRLWALLDEVERLVRRANFPELIDGILAARRRIVEMEAKSAGAAPAAPNLSSASMYIRHVL